MLEEKILWAAIEDYAGLWEVIWEFSDKIPPVHFNEIQSTVIKLYKKGYIELFKCEEPDGDIIKINNGCDDILINITSWNPPDRFGFTIRISATESGKNYYKLLTRRN